MASAWLGRVRVHHSAQHRLSPLQVDVAEPILTDQVSIANDISISITTTLCDTLTDTTFNYDQ